MPDVNVRQYSVLIVDDSAAVRSALQDLFELSGFHVQTAGDGEEGLNVLQEGSHWDLVLLDVKMPKLNGFDMLREMRRNGSKVPVVMLTAAGDRQSVLSGFDLGATDYITKPFNPEVLMARISAIIRRRERRADMSRRTS